MGRNNLKDRQLSQKRKKPHSPNNNQPSIVIPGLTRDPQAARLEQNFRIKTNRNLHKSAHHTHP